MFVFAGILFTIDMKHSITDCLLVVIAFILFCLISGSIYIINDISDIWNDRVHPEKKHRPIASGMLPLNIAWLAAIILSVFVIAVSFIINIDFGLIISIYFVSMVLYSYILKKLVIIDVAVIALGFVLRAMAGAEIIDVMISPWLLLCTTFIALFIGFGKRREELTELGINATEHRVNLMEYTVPYIDQLMNITAACMIISYSLYTFMSDTGLKHNYMYITIVFVIYGVFRYLFLAGKSAGAKSPELLLLSDKPLLINFILWVITCAVIILLG